MLKSVSAIAANLSTAVLEKYIITSRCDCRLVSYTSKDEFAICMGDTVHAVLTCTFSSCFAGLSWQLKFSDVMIPHL